MLNLCLVVIATQFAETKRRETESMAAERRRRRRRRRSSSTQASCSAEDDVPDSCYTEIIKYVAHVARRARRRLVRVVGRQTLVRRLASAVGLRRRNDADVVDVEVVERREAEMGGHPDETSDDDDGGEAAAAETRLTTPPVASTGIGSPLAPRASPEPSDVDPLSSPRWPRGSLVTPPGSAGNGSPPPQPGVAASSPRPAAGQRCTSTGSTTADRQADADLDYYNSLHPSRADNKGASCAIIIIIIIIIIIVIIQRFTRRTMSTLIAESEAPAVAIWVRMVQ